MRSAKQKGKDKFKITEILRQSLFLWPNILSALMIAVVYFVFIKKDDLVLFPVSGQVKIHSFDDRADRGNSQLIKTIRNDSSFAIEFILRSGFVEPYAGIQINPDMLLDVSGYNQIEVQMSGKGITSVWLHLLTQDTHVKDTANRLADRYSSKLIDLSESPAKVITDFFELRTPDWWFHVIKQSPNDFKGPEWNKLTSIDITSGLNAGLDQRLSVRVEKIAFRKDTKEAIIWMITVQLLITISSYLFLYLRLKNHTYSLPLIIQYKAVSVPEPKTTAHDFFDYLHHHFSEPELNLIQVSKETKVPPRIISDTISEKFGCNFKTYVNQIRIRESQRLLKETKLSISEIAYKTGFNSPGNFNRVFKNITGTTPSEYSQKSDN